MKETLQDRYLIERAYRKAVFVKIVVFNEIQSNSLNSQQFVQMFSNIKDVGRPFCVIPDVRDCCALWL